jgi:peptidoglycan/LPS O-acetylase OafA/YrhL
MVQLRKVIAVAALLALAGLIWTLERGSYGVNPRLVVATRGLLFPLGVAIIGVALEKYWGRWLALAAAVVVLPWAIVLTFGLPPGAPLMQQTIALVASALLLVTLSGRTMFERYEGRSTTDWSGPRMGLVRWTIIFNIASAVALFLFVAVYRYTIEWYVAFPAVLLVALMTGVLLLARQKTLGLVLVALGCVLFVPAAVLFVWKESSYAGGVRIFAMSFMPGVLAGWACLFAFGGPVWRALRSD